MVRPAVGSEAETISQVESLLNSGDYLLALEGIQRVLSSKRNDPKALFLHARILTAIDQPTEAEQVYRHLIATFPNQPEPYNNLAALRLARNDVDGAMTLLLGGIATSARYQTLYRNLSGVYETLAKRAYHEALGEGPDGTPEFAPLRFLPTLDTVKSP
jgi:Flp pilus assembly protein TadD